MEWFGDLDQDERRALLGRLRKRSQPGLAKRRQPADQVSELGFRRHLIGIDLIRKYVAGQAFFMHGRHHWRRPQEDKRL